MKVDSEQRKRDLHYYYQHICFKTNSISYQNKQAHLIDVEIFPNGRLRTCTEANNATSPWLLHSVGHQQHRPQPHHHCRHISRLLLLNSQCGGAASCRQVHKWLNVKPALAPVQLLAMMTHGKPLLWGHQEARSLLSAPRMLRPGCNHPPPTPHPQVLKTLSGCVKCEQVDGVKCQT